MCYISGAVKIKFIVGFMLLMVAIAWPFAVGSIWTALVPLLGFAIAVGLMASAIGRSKPKRSEPSSKYRPSITERRPLQPRSERLSMYDKNTGGWL